MDVEEALELVEDLIYAKTGRHLNDLEREVFIGSWRNQTYEEIYPLNPEYVERNVGYKLWQKLSNILGERVTKKNIRGAIERQKSRWRQPADLDREMVKTSQRVFISHRSQEPDLSLAKQFCDAINAAGHQAFMATVEANSPSSGSRRSDNWFAFIDSELEQCDYFLLLLSPQAAVSEIVIEELRQAKQLRDSRPSPKPALLPIRVNCPLSASLNHDLRTYLLGIGQREWKSPADTPILLQEVLTLLSDSGEDVGAVPLCPPWSRDEILSAATTPNEASNGENASLTPPPLPVAEPELEPELPSGQVRLASAFYVERVPDEARCYEEVLKPGALIRIKAPRQMGKTSLMARILYQAKKQGYLTVPLSFQHADTAVFTNLNELLQWFCAKITRKLRLPDQVDDYWTDTYGSKNNCTAYFEDCLLPKIDTPLVLGLDEVDRVFQYPTIADDFFGLLRAWYEEAGYGDLDSNLWEKLRLVVVHSTEVYIPLNVNQSPFNVGLPIELSEFSLEQVSDLAQRHGLKWHTDQVEQLMKIVGGHPYLVRVALYHIAQQQLTLEQVLEFAPTEAGIYGDHLRRHLWSFQQHPELAAAFAKVVAVSNGVELPSTQAFKLHSMGLVQLQGNHVTPRFELYREYFRDRLGMIGIS